MLTPSVSIRPDGTAALTHRSKTNALKLRKYHKFCFFFVIFFLTCLLYLKLSLISRKEFSKYLLDHVKINKPSKKHFLEIKKLVKLFHGGLTKLIIAARLLKLHVICMKILNERTF